MSQGQGRRGHWCHARTHGGGGNSLERGVHEVALRTKSGIAHEKQRIIRAPAPDRITVRIPDIPRGCSVGTSARGVSSGIGNTAKTVPKRSIILGNLSRRLGIRTHPANFRGARHHLIWRAFRRIGPSGTRGLILYRSHIVHGAGDHRCPKVSRRAPFWGRHSVRIRARTRGERLVA